MFITSYALDTCGRQPRSLMPKVVSGIPRRGLYEIYSQCEVIIATLVKNIQHVIPLEHYCLNLSPFLLALYVATTTKGNGVFSSFNHTSLNIASIFVPSNSSIIVSKSSVGGELCPSCEGALRKVFTSAIDTRNASTTAFGSPLENISS
eukprot:Gb_10481 [translate_table: standard]